jgi:hypothetical protein
VSGSRPLKAPDARRNNHAPRQGEWVELKPLSEPVMPAYPIDWYRRDVKPFVVPKYIWDAWRADPVTSQWSSSDIATALDLGFEWTRLKPEHRLRVQTILGLNPKGRRDLRWREPEEAAAVKETEQAEVRRLRFVGEEKPDADDRCV